jgi:hypothetical protein
MNAAPEWSPPRLTWIRNVYDLLLGPDWREDSTPTNPIADVEAAAQ